MDDLNIETPETPDNFATDIAKIFALNLAASVGAMAGFALLAVGYSAVVGFKERRNNKKNALTLVEETD